MSETIKANFIAEGDLEQLKSTITFLNQQKLILESLAKGLKIIISKHVNRHHKCHRIRPMLELIYQKENDAEINRLRRELAELGSKNNAEVEIDCRQQQVLDLALKNKAENDRRRRALAELDLVSKALSVFSLRPARIYSLEKTSFDALVRGLPKFVEAKPGRRDFIETAIGAYVQDTITEFEQKVLIIDQTPSYSTTVRREDRPTKRLKMTPTHCPDAGRPEPPRIPSLAPTSSTTASMVESVLPDRRDQAHAEQPNRTELNSQLENLSARPWPDSNMGFFESECGTDDAGCQPDRLTRGLAEDISMMEMEEVSQLPLDFLPYFPETWWLGRELCLGVEPLSGEVAFDSSQREQRPVSF
ncbi:hypothetical protein QQZ08_009384 [Neonectria magnoliae]|uniref:Uncharacterized protein n=1 Tax=Neonectria magnoliae TaxID=2732573 RepID=A0ABR1HP78_9HYPO